MSNLRFVLDTNVIISAALLPKSIVRQAFDRAVTEGTILLSDEILLEWERIIRKPKFNKYILEDERIEFLSGLNQEASRIKITELITQARDQKDNKFLELAVSGHASCIVSGDEDLLVLHPFRGIPILTPRQFLEWLEGQLQDEQGDN